MKQYDIYRAGGKFSDSDLAYIIVLQSGDFSNLKTAISAPVRKLEQLQIMKNLHISITVEGEGFYISMAELSAFPLKQLGPLVENQSACHSDVMVAVDLLFAGF